jgi:hypothetical protein
MDAPHLEDAIDHIVYQILRLGQFDIGVDKAMKVL